MIIELDTLTWVLSVELENGARYAVTRKAFIVLCSSVGLPLLMILSHPIGVNSDAQATVQEKKEAVETGKPESAAILIGQYLPEVLIGPFGR